MPSPLFTDPSDVDSPHSRASIRTSEKRPNQDQPRSQVGNRYAMSRTLNIVRGRWVWWTRSYRQGASNMPPSLDSSPPFWTAVRVPGEVEAKRLKNEG